MAKKAPETVVMTPNEIKLINMNFAADLGTANLSGAPTFTVSADGPATASETTTGQLAQAKFDATGVSAGLYTVTVTASDDSTPTQTFEGIGELLVEEAST